ncbi:uncharacterized protein MONBRDRAFT_30469 [Monosiga brevicollis MX1]|uniref:PiggyBac transposable element-derived protein domain-containing protein n=1 Tax=Monosiga brevicollis TaxID=81824 RepID=A9VE17_MONBE|nr:uncharacterized protein MONBRDRAFT_30469 [Monosiga brevicollis MX1]EDQ84231.1 predicted protein [Monosiga brevicollis MX1]|eukprot:XP_001750955.1 hypothetical protein [Monosiga brevicollis MX1]
MRPTPAPLTHVSVIRHMLHPRFCTAGLTENDRERVKGLVVLGTAQRPIRGQLKEVLLLVHGSVDDELYTLRWCIETSPAPQETLTRARALLSSQPNPAGLEPAAGSIAVEDPDAAPPLVARVKPPRHRLAPMSVGELDFDVATDEEEDSATWAPMDGAPAVFEAWGSATIDPGHERANFKARAPQLDDAFALDACDPGHVFLHFLPPRILENMLRGSSVASLSKEELLGFFGLQLLGANHARATEDLFKPSQSQFDVFPDFSSIMSQHRFREIAKGLRLTDTKPRGGADPFHAVREMAEAFNDHMAKSSVFRPSSLVCLDESMVTHHQEEDPGFVFIGRKPHPVGNEYHAICDAETGIVYRIEMVEGKARPRQLPLKYAEHGQTGGLILRMTETSVGMGRVVVMDSAFCELQPLVELRNRVCLAHDIVLWKHGPERKGRVDRDIISYHRNQPLDDYYNGRHAVHDHNQLRQCQKRDLEMAWDSKFWDIDQLVFVVSTTLVNTLLWYNRRYLAPRGRQPLSLSELRSKVGEHLVQMLVNSRPGMSPALCQPHAQTGTLHRLISIPPYQGSRPGKRVKARYQAVRCRGENCHKMVRKYCLCSPVLFLCIECFALHIQ